VAPLFRTVLAKTIPFVSVIAGQIARGK